jgi:tRNA threonylcarbamoyladenosine biosynthesis protein TsaE
MTLEIVSTSSEDTERLGERLGSKLKGGEVIELVSDLGGGKTTFVRGLARGMGSQDHVSSPTFKISNIYKASKLELHHFDFYRLGEAGIVADELEEIVSNPHVVVVIEWGSIVQNVLPKNRLTITFISSGQNSRTIDLNYSKRLDYLIK